MLVTFLIRSSAIIPGTGFLDETLLSRHFRGIAMIVHGLASIDGRSRNDRTRQANV